MTVEQTIMTVILALGGLGLFLYGMKLLGDGLELAAGSKLRQILEKLTTNRYLGAFVGLVVTAVIQSSTTVSVMVVGFVNAGLMTLSQAIGVIMGANIGTTITSLILSINIAQYMPVLICIGAFMVVLSKKNNTKHIGQIIAGFGILFFGMTTMSDNLKPLASSDFFQSVITSVENPIIGILFGIIFAGITQSSSATVGVLQALGMAGALTLPHAAYIIYGINIGACSTAVISSIGATRAAKRTAMSHVIFNVIGTLMFTLVTIFTPYLAWVHSAAEGIAPGNVPLQISILHVTFNIISTIILLPCSGIITKIACMVIPGEDAMETEACRLKYVDERILNTPPIAVNQITKEIDRMGRLSRRNFGLAMQALLTKDEKLIEKVEENEQVIDYLNQEITTYLVKINGLSLEDTDRVKIGSYFHVVSDMERIGDHAENIGEMTSMLIRKNENFSEAAITEINDLKDHVVALMDDAMEMFDSKSYSQKAVDEVSRIEQEIDDKTAQYKDNHIDRLGNGKCSATVGTIFMELLTNLERIADHGTNIAFSAYPSQHAPHNEAEAMMEQKASV